MNIGSIQAFDNKFNEMMKVPVVESAQVQSKNFDNILFNSIDALKETQETAKVNMADVLMGNADNAYSALISMEKAGLQMQFASSVRDKVTSGINQMLNMQI